jgi:hypothetical protein
MSRNAQDRAWDMRNLVTAEIELRDRLNGLEQEWVIGKLGAHRGICAVHAGADSLIVEYDADVVNVTDLASFLHICGLTSVGTRLPTVRREL